MANTTNFGWETPDDTDLVKDGAAAMRTLGNSIDASFVDLKGGTTGQILSKNSNTDLDYIWINNDQGDITAVTAGTGISGGGTSGAVTITNSMATEITASGDIIVGTGSGTFDNLPIGSTGQVLTADTTVSPYKVKWASVISAFSGASVYSNADQTISNATLTNLTWNQEDYDTDTYHDNSTNNTRLTIPSGKSGYYKVTLWSRWTANATGRRIGYFYKNGTNVSQGESNPSATGEIVVPLERVLYLTAGDYIEAAVYQTSGGNLDARKDTSNSGSYFQITYLGA